MDIDRWRSISAEEWNARYPVGTAVLYFPIQGDKEHVLTETRSQAWNLGHGEPVVKVIGRAGGVALSHLMIADAIPDERGVGVLERWLHFPNGIHVSISTTGVIIASLDGVNWESPDDDKEVVSA